MGSLYLQWKIMQQTLDTHTHFAMGTYHLKNVETASTIYMETILTYQTRQTTVKCFYLLISSTRMVGSDGVECTENCVFYRKEYF